MGKKPVVKLRVYRGRKLSYNQDGSVQNENQIISVEHGTKQWSLTLSNLPISGYCKIEIEKVLKIIETDIKNEKGKIEQIISYEEIKDINSYEEEIKDALNPKKNIVKTADQLRIEKLEAQLQDFMNKGNKEDSKKEINKKGDSESKSNLKDEYQELYGKKAFNGWDEEKLIQMIKEKK